MLRDSAERQRSMGCSLARQRGSWMQGNEKRKSQIRLNDEIEGAVEKLLIP